MKHTLFNSAALMALFATGAAFAQPVSQPADTTAEAGEVIVYGQGQSRQTQTVKSKDITLAAPGTSPLKVLDKLPGVSFQSSDPFGAYEWSTRISVRGFNQNQMGFTLDGVTLGDMSYGNYNGLHVSRAIINEDVASAELAQGAGGLDSATSSNLGGTLKFTSRNPSDVMGGEVDATVGSDGMHRVYGRFETGEIKSLGGLRGYISGVNQQSDKWKGYGERRAEQLNLKAVLPLGEGSLTGFVNTSKRREQDDQDLSLDMIKRLGYNWDNFQPNWALANQVASIYQSNALFGTPANYPAPITTVDDSYYYGGGVRDDTISGLTLALPLTDKISLDATAYQHQNEGQGLWVTPYQPSPNAYVAGSTTDNAFVSIRTTEYDIDRKGLTAGLTFDLGAHVVSTGLWLEDNDFTQARRFYAENLSAPKRDSLGFQSNPFLTSWEYAFNTKTTQAYVQDVWSLSDALKVNFGFKALKVTNKVNQKVGGTIAATLESKDNFLPQVGFVYKLNPTYEFFGSYAENMAAYVSAATAGPFASQSQANINYVRDNLQPEQSKTYEGGMRFKFDRFQGVAALYHVNFDNRILAVTQGAGIVGNAPVLSNVGGVETNGLELAGTYRFTPDWKLYASATYNQSEYADDVVNIVAGAPVKTLTKGKTVVNTPKSMIKSELSYDNGNLFGTLSVDHVGERYYTYTNVGGKVPAYTLSDLTVGYRFNSLKLDVQLNVTNLTDEQYVSTIGSNGFTNADASNTSQTVLAGAPRQVFLAVKKHF
jgi:iron complex outermembrane recepter protein